MSGAPGPTHTPATPPAETPTEKPNEEQQQPDPPRGPLSEEPQKEGEEKPEEKAVAFDVEKLTLPEGFQKNEHFDKFTEFAKANGWSHELSQKAFDMHLDALRAQDKFVNERWENQQREWLTQIKADPELKDIDQVKQTVARVLDNPKFADPDFRSALNFTGAGTNPAIVRTIYRLCAALSEGGAVAGDPAGRTPQGQTTIRNPAEAIYGAEGPHTGGPKLAR